MEMGRLGDGETKGQSFAFISGLSLAHIRGLIRSIKSVFYSHHAALNLLNFLNRAAPPSTIYPDDLAHMNKSAFLHSYNSLKYN